MAAPQGKGEWQEAGVTLAKHRVKRVVSSYGMSVSSTAPPLLGFSGSPAQAWIASCPAWGACSKTTPPHAQSVLPFFRLPQPKQDNLGAGELHADGKIHTWLEKELYLYVLNSRSSQRINSLL